MNNGTPKKADPLALPWMQPFLDAFAETGIVATACKRAGVGRTTVYMHRQRDAAFASAFEQARKVAVSGLEDEAWRRAKKSDTLLIFLLKAHGGAQYRETVAQQHEGTLRIEIVESHDSDLD